MRLPCSAGQDTKVSSTEWTSSLTGALGGRGSVLLGVGGALGLLLAAGGAHAAETGPHFHPVAADIQNLAQDEEFWSNLGRYGRYFVTVLLGTAYTAVKPVAGLLRRPATAAIVVVTLVGLYFFVTATLNGMLGTNQEPLNLYG